MQTATINLPPKLLPIFAPARGEVRYRGAYGGRGSGKSFSFAKMAAVFGFVEPLRILCTRELQISIKESFYAELRSAILSEPWLANHYRITNDSIKGINGTEFIFRGLRHNMSSIKSMAQVDICIVEEAEDVPEDSWIDLEPTIRAPNSEIWVIWNPREEGSPVDLRFRQHVPPRSKIAQINFNDNPAFPKVLEDLRLHQYDTMKRALYMHIWEGHYLDWGDEAFFPESYMLEDGKPVAFPTRCDQVFAVVDTALKDGLEHDGTAVTYYARNRIAGHPLIVLDYDLIQIEGSFLPQWIPSVNKRLDDLATQVGARYGNRGMWIEDKASGIVLLQQAQRAGLPAYPIEGALVAAGKEGRAISISTYVHGGQVKLSEYAFNKLIEYKGVTRNHFLSQICGFRIGVKTPHEYDLLDTFTYGVAIALGDSSGY